MTSAHNFIAPAIAAGGLLAGNYASDNLIARMFGGVPTQTQSLIGAAALFGAGLAVNHMTTNSYAKAGGMGLSISGLVHAFNNLKGGM